MGTTTTDTAPKRSVKLTEAQKQTVETVVRSCKTKTAAAIKLGVSREVLDRIRTFGSCKETTFKTLFGENAVPAEDDALSSER